MLSCYLLAKMEMDKKKLYHELLAMTPFEIEALRESGKQIIGLPPSPEWVPMSVTKPVVHHGHYKRWIAMPTGHEMAHALQRDVGGGLFDSIKHGFATLVQNAAKVHGAVKSVVGPAKKVAETVAKFPVVGKYAGKAVDVLAKVEAGLEVAEKGIRIAEGLDRRINRPAQPAAGRADNPFIEQPPIPPYSDPSEQREWGRAPPPRPANPTQGQYGAGLRGRGLRGRGVPGGGLFRA